MAAHNWRLVRSKVRDKGIAVPMSLPSMHDILDVAEEIAIEGEAQSARKPEEAKRAVERYFDRLYAPDSADAILVNGDGYRPPPPGFDEESQEASFDAFLAATR
ncbi:hypothetical protein PBI_THONKO_39 [Mycobacterium phage Thonko]|uniref:Uncharacterized protein n=1 Tax=Mycobacterium phage Thonko TaxID=2282910 RepID=A0A346FC86_9CAUD|nr:hypothetical protein I5G57_gp039 [Mycobacterium phage Thonko]AXN53311.1 hypothetical protein PBI_THONKO_39 [Mycobacterium phage Thonko]